MEVRVEIEYDPFLMKEGETRDRIIRAIDRELGGRTVWEKNGDGWVVSA
jgi:hypothetical protein